MKDFAGNSWDGNVAGSSTPAVISSFPAQLGYYHDNTYGSYVQRQWEWKAVEWALDASNEYYTWMPIYKGTSTYANGLQSDQTSMTSTNAVINGPAIEINNNSNVVSGQIVYLTPSKFIPPNGINNVSNQFYTFQLAIPASIKIGRLMQTTANTDTSTMIEYYNLDGSWSASVGCWNPLGLSGSSGVGCCVIPNPINGYPWPWSLICVKQFAQNVLNSLTYDSTNGILNASYILANLNGPQIDSNQSLTGSVQVFTTIDAGTDLQRDATTISAPVITPSSPHYGETGVTITSQVSHSDGVANPTGYIKFQPGGTSGAIDSAGNGSITITGDLLAGSSFVTAYYNGDSSYAQSTSGNTSYTLQAATTTCTVTAQDVFGSPITSWTWGDTVTLVATISLPGGYNNCPVVGNVQFQCGSTVLSTVATKLTFTLPTTWTAKYTSTAISNVGTAAIQANYTNSDSTTTTCTGSANFTVNKATLTVTTQDASATYGGTIPAFTPKITGYKNYDGIWVLSGAFSITSTGNSTSVVGTYPISATTGTATATNYQFTFANTGILTIVPANLTVTANSFSLPKGSAAPSSYPVSITNIQNSDDITGNITDPHPNMDNGGSWALNPQVNHNQNINCYNVSLVAGMLTIY